MALRGVLGILLGLTAVGWILALDLDLEKFWGFGPIVRPGAILAVLVLVLGLYAFVDGIFAVLLGAQDYGDGRRWGALIVEGFFSIALGILTWFWPGTALA